MTSFLTYTVQNPPHIHPRKSYAFDGISDTFQPKVCIHNIQNLIPNIIEDTLRLYYIYQLAGNTYDSITVYSENHKRQIYIYPMSYNNTYFNLGKFLQHNSSGTFLA